MARIINLQLKRILSNKDSYKLGKPVVGMKAVAMIKGKEQSGMVVYKRKAEYKDIFENED
ncbi:hypothetical protein [Neobacillus niacini]|uniref:hypothetical protein n=1 Tax=Neobacillus niacini TaxID=86668 RepID=UPI00285CC3A4|nr:hypothetical protein [Neobacillus niacini]MDR7000082.1 hypothetical protein [Neobacillus niacini]